MEGLIRAARPADAQAIAAVHVATWRDAYAGLLADDVLAGLDTGEWAARWRGRLAAPAEGTFVLVFEQDGQVGGFVSGGPSRDDFVGGEVYALYVDPSRQARGAGSRLLAVAAGQLAESDYADASLWVLAGNQPARRFYESQGWRADGTEQPWIQHGGASVMEVRYVRNLTFLRAAGRPGPVTARDECT